MSRFSFWATVFCFLIASEVEAHRSKIPSSVEGIKIPNTHEVATHRGTLYRGGAPIYWNELEQLVEFGMTHYLIFKNETHDEVRTEIERLEKLGVDRKRIAHIPFKWKEMESFQKSCEQTLEALRLLRSITWKWNGKLFYHCTVGEDRTGFLSGLYRMLYYTDQHEQGEWDVNRAFSEEMCENGYEKGNPDKPKWVVDRIYRELTYLYFRMAFLIEDGQLTLEDLDKKICKNDPGETQAFEDFMRFQIHKKRCPRSSKYPLE